MRGVEKFRMVKLLREEARRLAQDGFTDFFSHTFTCLRYGQAMKDREEDRCGDCPLRPFVSPEDREEMFPCQHLSEDELYLAAETPDLAEKCSAWLMRTADQLEAEAKASYAKEKVI